VERKDKTVKTIFLFLAGLFLLLFLHLDSSFGHASNQDAIIGKWRNLVGTVEIEVYKNNDKYHGKILWLKDRNYRGNDPKGIAGKPRMNHENPDPALKNKLLINSDLFGDCVFTENQHWEKGFLYDHLNGKKYECSISMYAPDRLKVRGYIGPEILGTTMFFKRIKE
jgi:uncharacterized protein (DUF2147 family)